MEWGAGSEAADGSSDGAWQSDAATEIAKWQPTRDQLLTATAKDKHVRPAGFVKKPTAKARLADSVKPTANWQGLRPADPTKPQPTGSAIHIKIHKP